MKHMLTLIGKKLFTNFTLKSFVYLNLCETHRANMVTGHIHAKYTMLYHDFVKNDYFLPFTS